MGEAACPLASSLSTFSLRVMQELSTNVQKWYYPMRLGPLTSALTQANLAESFSHQGSLYAGDPSLCQDDKNLTTMTCDMFLLILPLDS